MISVYLVDDEPMAIQYMEMLLASCGYPCEIAGKQTNSMRAYYEIRSIRPDIVFTDISMPVMDGLELAEKIVRSGDTRVYLLTSYEDFDYAKRSVKIGAADYLLKNEMTEEMLRGVLEEAEREITAARRERQLILERNIRDFLLGSSDVPEDHIYEDRSMQRYALLLFYRLPKLWMDPGLAPDENLSLDTYMLQNLDCPKGMRCTAFAQIQNRVYCAVVFINESVVDSRRRLYQMGDGILSKLAENDRDWKCIGSDICLHFFELQAAYRQLASRTAYLYACRDQSMLGIYDVPVPEEDAAACEELMEEIGRYLEVGDHEHTVRSCERFFALCRQHDSQTAYTEHMRNLYRMLRRVTLRDGRGLNYLALSNCYAGTTDLERALLNCVELYFQERERSANAQYSDHVLRAMQCIRKEYVRDISVAEIADYAGVSEGHLRRLFKQEMNMSVIDYVTEYRMQRAKHLLRDHLKNPSEVWRETGFSSAQYFSYVFKKKEGISPREYQKHAGSPGGDVRPGEE